MPDEFKSFSVISRSPEQTRRMGFALGVLLKAGECVSLSGELGSGKTCFTQGIASALGVPDDCPVSSPTFTLLNEYEGREFKLYHLDAYRLSGVKDLQDIGFYDYLGSDGVLVVEWADKIADAIDGEVISVNFAYVDESARRLNFSGSNKLGVLQSALADLANSCFSSEKERNLWEMAGKSNPL